MHHFIDPDNHIVQLCAEGMQEEGAGRPGEAKALFDRAWEMAGNALEQCIAAHYVARQQDSIAAKLEWDARALECAGRVNDEGVKSVFPSLYLNLGKGYEDLGDREQALQHYQQALFFSSFLAGDGYGKMMLSGIEAGLRRIQAKP